MTALAVFLVVRFVGLLALGVFATVMFVALRHVCGFER